MQACVYFENSLEFVIVIRTHSLEAEENLEKKKGVMGGGGWKDRKEISYP
jgi:hypothetical protein